MVRPNKKNYSFSGQFPKIFGRQWQLIPETTMHAFDINALLTMIAINKLTERTRK
jgi:hypothetical protein